MSTLLLRLAGPLQAWGADSKFETRRTLTFPTKSGVIGMLAAALGRSREESIEDLNRLKFGVRVDKEGELVRDYHTVKGEKPYITERFYLSDAIFLAGVESDDGEFVRMLENALKSPAFPLFLGRRSCPPTQPLLLGIREKGLLDSLENEPWQLEEWRQKRIYDDSEYLLRIIMDAGEGESMSVLRDEAVSFSSKHRRFGFRAVSDCGYVDMSLQKEASICTGHDPMAESR